MKRKSKRKRPPRKWYERCVRDVKGKANNAWAMCNATWNRASEKTKKRIRALKKNR